jgi:Glycosyl hydrolases family 25/Putative peptidoglycan binding domain
MINGIDIYHGDVITLQDMMGMVKNNNLYFIYIKATTGGSGKDAQFANYWQMARKAGLVCGAYHFFWPVTDAGAQVNNFVTQYKQVSRSGVLPPVVDIEWTKVTAGQKEFWNQVSPANRILIIKDFLQKAELLLNVKPIIYTANSFWQEFITPHSSADDHAFFAQYQLWIADPNNNGRRPLPWSNSTPLITQNHLGDNVPRTAPLFQRLDNDVFNGSLLQLLNTTVPGFTLMKGFPFSMVVKQVQEALRTKQFLTDTADGFFGNNTGQAVIKFQNANGLLGNGIVDAQTWNKLLS